MIKLTNKNLTNIEEIISWIIVKQELLHIDCEEDSKLDGVVGNACYNIKIINKNIESIDSLFNL